MAVFSSRKLQIRALACLCVWVAPPVALDWKKKLWSQKMWSSRENVETAAGEGVSQSSQPRSEPAVLPNKAFTPVRVSGDRAAQARVSKEEKQTSNALHEQWWQCTWHSLHEYWWQCMWHALHEQWWQCTWTVHYLSTNSIQRRERKQRECPSHILHVNNRYWFPKHQLLCPMLGVPVSKVTSLISEFTIW